jgi:alkylation response protein AidB-like acyl-CoA dehydrogenase
MTVAVAPDLHALSDEMVNRSALDFEDLRRAGYLLLAVPVEFGGLGGNLVQACHQQRRLGRRSPAAAGAGTMHICWTGVAAELYRSGDGSLNWLLEEAGAGKTVTGPASLDAHLWGYLTWTRCIFASILLGIGDRALELAVAEAMTPTDHPLMKHLVAEIALEVEVGSSLAEHVAHDWSGGADHTDRWVAKLAAVERRAGDGSRRVVELALELAGDFPPPELVLLDQALRTLDPPDSVAVQELLGEAVLAGMRG